MLLYNSYIETYSSRSNAFLTNNYDDSLQSSNYLC